MSCLNRHCRFCSRPFPIHSSSWRRKLGSVLRQSQTLGRLGSTDQYGDCSERRCPAKALEGPLRADAEILGYPGLTIEPATTAGEFSKLAVRAGTRILFTIDLTRISAVIRGELVEFPIASDSGEHVTVQVPSRNLQLLFKAEAFLRRPFLKTRDAFDIKLLQDSGAVLSDSLTVHLVDGPAAERLEKPEFITQRIAQVNSRTCTPELQPYLPQDVFEELESSDFEPLRAALRQLFSAWL